MLKAFSKILYGNRTETETITEIKEENTMAKKTNTKANETTNNVKEEVTMKTTGTKANKGKSTNKSTKAKENGTMKKMTQKEQLENILEAVNVIKAKLDTIEERVNILEEENTTETKAKGTKGKATKGKTTKGKAKNTATSKAKPVTKAEAIEAWKSAKYTEAERKAYGEAAKEIREEMMAENKKMVKTVKGKKVYDDNYYVGAKWTREFNRRMAERGFGKAK